ncbi:MAG TPA: XamI family restriction endonuclease [Hyphomicrobiaceae bacterium]|nr:XamI family restriction endonuclease [Hyphomicrobiaceae bacterium]
MSKEYHAEQAARARVIYAASRTAESDASDWEVAIAEARSSISNALRASDYLRDVPGAIRASGEHSKVIRHILAPPLSQDQFSLFYPSWSKSSEKAASRRPSEASASAVGKAVGERRWESLTPWIESGRKPTRRELERVYWAIGTLIASQHFATIQRNRLARIQEQDVIAILVKNGWTKLPSSLLDTRASLPARHFMHKTRFATATSRPQEVDVALGLGGSVVLAMECKVTNDATNSIKRINDILKKAHAWKEHWGSFVRTAALLQGVIAEKDVVRLLDANVEVFWSHDLERFEDWIASA